MRGFSMWFCVDKWAGFQIDFCHVTWFRIVIGWFSFAIFGCDIDRVLAHAVESRADIKESAVQQPTSFVEVFEHRCDSN